MLVSRPLAIRLTAADSMEFVTVVQTRPRALATGNAPEMDSRTTEWQRLTNQITLVGAKVVQIFNVLGNDFNLLIVGEAKDPRTLQRIDAICEREGYPARTHPVIPAAEYTMLVEETNAILNNRFPRRSKLPGQ